MSTRKQMPCEGLPQVVPNDQNLKWGYRVYKTFLISLVLLLYTLYPLYSCTERIHAFWDFTIRDSFYFVILFQASISWIPRCFVILKKKHSNDEHFANDGQLFLPIWLFLSSPSPCRWAELLRTEITPAKMVIIQF